MTIKIIDSDTTPRLRELECSEIILSWVDGGELIVDGKEVISLKKVIRILEAK